MKRFLIAILVIFCCSWQALALDNTLIDKANDDSCIGHSGTQRLRTVLATGAYLWWLSTDFQMVGDDPNLEQREGSCKQPVQDGQGVKFCYQPSFLGNAVGSKECSTLAHDRTYTRFPFFARGQNVGDMLCIQVPSILGWVNLGCKYRATPRPANPDGMLNCAIATSCTSRIVEGGTDDQGNVIAPSQSMLPITAPIVQCVEESVRVFFFGKAGCSSGLLPTFQNNMRNIVSGLLILYVIFFGIKIVLGKEMPQKHDIFLFLLKISAVTYFSVGYGSAMQDNGVYQIYNFFMSILKDLVLISLQAGQPTNGLCNFGVTETALWDSLDCRMTFYLGLNNFDAVGALIINYILSAVATVLTGGTAIVISIGYITYLIITILVALIIISIIVHVVHVYLVAMVVITVIVFTAPIFVPMVLFQFTKNIFDAWVKALFGYAIQPMILFIFLGFVFNIMDRIVYQGCEFEVDTNIESTKTFLNNIGINVPASFKSWKISNITEDMNSDDQSDAQKACASSYGGFIQTATSFGVNVAGNGQVDFKGVLNSAILTLVVAMIFYFFVSLVDSIAADITGVSGLTSMAISGTGVVDKAVDIGVKAAMAIADVAAKAVTAATGVPVSPVVDAVSEGARQGLASAKSNIDAEVASPPSPRANVDGGDSPPPSPRSGGTTTGGGGATG